MVRKIILTFIKKHKLTYAIGIIFMLLNSYVQSLLPKVLGNAVDILKIRNFDAGLVKINILYILIIAAGAFACTYMWRNFIIANARTLECHMREMLYTQFQKLSPEFYSKRKTGDLIAYAINDISAVRMVFGPASAMSINGTVICLISIISMVQAISWRLTVISLIPVPFIVIIMLKIGKLVQKRFRKVQESFAAISDRVQENIYGIRVIKSYVQEDSEVESFARLNNQMANANISMIKISSLLSPAIELSFSISFVMNLIIGGNMVLSGVISLGDFIAFNGYLTLIMAPVLNIGRVINIFQRGMASLKRLEEIFRVEPQVQDGEKGTSSNIKGEIEFKNLDFTYPGTTVKSLENISIYIPKGRTVGIVGKTGSGKSTVANLLLKLYNVPSGMLYIDGIDINDYTLEALRDGFGYVPQDNFLFSASVRDNITFFKDDFSEDEIEQSAKDSCIYDSVIELPDGFDTILGERGVNLSGGQKQRISIARALIKDPPVLILDDSLSAVDAITEARILENFKEIRKGKTTIIIAHRMSAVKDADEIFLLENGRILEHGTHSDLMKR